LNKLLGTKERFINNFEKHGFLAEDDLSFVNALEDKYGSYLSICSELNEFSQKLQYELDIHNECNSEILSATCYSQVLSTYQAIVLISRKGMKQQFHVLLRCMLEPLFPLVAISKNSSFANALVEADEIERLKNINKYIRYCERNNIKSNDLSRAQKLKAKVAASNKAKNLKKITIYDSAKEAGLEKWYDILYSHTSSYLHATVSSLEDQLILDENKQKIMALKNEPELDGFGDLYSTLIHCMLTAIQAVCSIFKLEEPAIIEKISATLMKLESKSA
jgi:hypothetical protein